MEIFETCQKIGDLLTEKKEIEARNELIKLLAYNKRNNIPATEYLNHIIRQTGLYPYLITESSLWQDRFVHEAFKVDVGGRQMTLHREQSRLLGRLLNGDDLAVSAPTSFGKSFIIDAFIAIKKPKNVVIIVPTIALTDETRRRLYKKFSKEYKIVTTTDVPLGEKNICVFPQERAIQYVDKINNLDILIVDEFYKASSDFDGERSPLLVKAIIKLGQKAKQRYYLAPNISNINENPFTKGMAFEKVDFNTVYLETYELYKNIDFKTGDRGEVAKGEILLSIITENPTKSIIYAASYSQIKKVSTLFLERLPVLAKRPLLDSFSDWLSINYGTNWNLANLVKRGVGIHNGQLHRSVSQVQVRLFDESDGLDNLVTTSSLIEGVNTSAENVIIWRNRKSGSNSIFDNFTYKNIIGRGGRMFKYFVGNVYLLEPPAKETDSQLDIPFPDSILDDLNEDQYKDSLNQDQVQKIIANRQAMQELVGKPAYDELVRQNIFQSNNGESIQAIAKEMLNAPQEWNGLAYLNSENVDAWDRFLNKFVYLRPGEWGEGPYSVQHPRFVAFVKALAGNWDRSIPDLLDSLEDFEVDIDSFFQLERIATFKLANLANEINILQGALLPNGADISSFIAKVSHAFLPSTVYQLEEYGLPRMISRKIHNADIINFTDEDLTIELVLERFRQIGKEQIFELATLDTFDRYIISYFFDGITIEE